MRTEAQKRADKKYREAGKDKYSNISAKIHVDNLEKIKKIALTNGLTLSKFTTRAVLYCAINGIDLSDFTQDFRKPQGENNEK